jgi:hypothetical protein
VLQGKLIITFLFFIALLFATTNILGQDSTIRKSNSQRQIASDDPSQFISRIELFNELHRFNKDDIYLNITTLRTLIKLGKRFSTRLEIPYVYNSKNTTGEMNHSGLGDISFRLLGYKILESRKSTLTMSMEVSLNTASSPLLGIGKNLLIPMVTYSAVVKPGKSVLSLLFQQVNSVSGDDKRETVSYSKIQGVLINIWSKRTWTVISPECYIDYVHGGVSMNAEGRLAYAFAPRINVALQLGVGLFGDFVTRYSWFAGVGGRYFLFRKSVH